MQPLVMIVDDESLIRTTLFDFLDDYEEFRLLLAESGEEALEQLQKQSADLCIVDMRLPGMTGKDFIRQASEQGVCRHFLLHTGSIDEKLYQDIRQYGMTRDDIFLKPYDIRTLLARIRALIG
jgi:DNA-binding response OmpR family regulator